MGKIGVVLCLFISIYAVAGKSAQHSDNRGDSPCRGRVPKYAKSTASGA